MFQFLKQIGWVGTLFAGVLAALWGVLTYQHKSRVDFQKPWIERHITICIEAAKAVGALTAKTEEAEWRSATEDFWQLYWGHLVLVEPPEVSTAMVKFGEKLNKTSFEQRRTLNFEAFAVSKQCRLHIEKMMEDGWKIEPLNDLKVN